VKIDFDPKKDAINRDKHGVSLSLATEIDWERISAVHDARQDYGEDRYFAAAPIGGRLYVVVFTLRARSLRIISLRKANRREIRNYETHQ
jgi:uncharacterized protein